MEYQSIDIDELRNRTEVPEDEQLEGNLAEDSFAALFEQFQANQDFKVGEIVEGRVLSVTKDYVVVDIGYKAEGQIPVSEFKNAEGVVDVTLKRRSLRRYADNDDDALVELSKEGATPSCLGSN